MNTPFEPGAKDPNSRIVDDNRETKRKQREYFQESDAIKQDFQKKLEELRAQRLELRLNAAAFAGKLGLIYHPETNSYVRPVIPDDFPTLPPPALLIPAEKVLEETAVEGVNSQPSTPSQVGAADSLASPPSTDNLSSQPVATSATELEFKRPERPLPEMPSEEEYRPSVGERLGALVSWAIVVPIGVFIGYGLDKLLDLSKVNFTRMTGNWPLFIIMVLIGLSMLVGLKFLFETLWKTYGEATQFGNLTWWQKLGYILFTAALALAEVFLTFTAFQVYLRATTLDGALPVDQFALFAASTVVAAPCLLYSAVAGYRKGRRTHLKSELDKRILQIKEEEYRELKKQYEEEELKVKREKQLEKDSENAIRQKQQELALQRIEYEKQVQDTWKEQQLALFKRRSELSEEGLSKQDQTHDKFEGVRKEPDFISLNQCIGAIESLTQEMNELEQRMTNVSISRGHGARYVL